ncbi:MAG: hypothetical protein K2X49_13955 [Acetobacteraceae bacterium]|nr:hypothetical protein [Acetobacteraceae bacterium]
MAQRAHLAEFAVTVTGDTARSLLDTYRESLDEASLSQTDIVSRLKAAMEAKLAETVDAPPPTVDH